MLVEFLFSGALHTRILARAGLLSLLLHALLKAWLAVQFTDFFRVFYDLMQSADPAQAAACLGLSEEMHQVLPTPNSTAHDVQHGGDTWIMDPCDLMEAKQAEVTACLFTFCRLALMAAVLHPVGAFVMSHVSFAWRIALVESYMVRWEVTSNTIEGSSQRIQEDTQRFAAGMDMAASVLLDAVLSLVVFGPRLYSLGQTVPPPGYSTGGGSPAWLLLLAVGLSLGGLLVSLLVAGKLVDIEVQNQKVEASFRKDLVLWESGVCAEDCTTGGQPDAADAADAADTPRVSWPGRISTILYSLIQNYYRLFLHFFFFNAWVGVFEQAVVILPYLLVAPRLFDAHNTVTLGVVVEVSRVFDRVFEALSVPMRNWAHVNNFRSTIRRLHEFERATTSTAQTVEGKLAAASEHQCTELASCTSGNSLALCGTPAAVQNATSPRDSQFNMQV
tara:strand:- start:577 stop:1914 length:1338 start_codon:yes stop_codon:yes gene_type:complete